MKPVPVFKVDMADPPYMRWQAIVKKYGKEVHVSSVSLDPLTL